MYPPHRASALALLLLTLLATDATLASAATIHVDQAGGGDYLTIQEGIDAAAYGDTVLVAPGTYYEHLYVGPTADGVTLLSEAGPESTIIDNEGASYYSVIHCENVGPDTRIEGFAITGGDSYEWGGGIRADDADVRIVSCTIIGCRALWMEGGGIGSTDSSIEVSGCRIEGNRAGDGGGIGVWGGEAIIKENTIISNAADSFAGNQSGGGIYVYCNHAEITDNLIEGNSALDGGGIQDWGGDETSIISNRIIGNYAGSIGGGMALYNSACFASGNTVAGNHANQFGGGAVDVRNTGSSPPRASAQFINNVFFGNTSDGDESAIRIRQSGPTPIFNHNFFADDTTYEVLVTSTPSADTIDFTGNWWGTDDPDEIAAKIYDCNDDPGLLWCIDFSDWCTDASCDGQVTSVEDPPEAAPVSWGRIKSLYR